MEAPDWRIWSEQHRDEYDSLEDAVDAFLADALDEEELDRRIQLGTRFLENVVTMSDFPVDKIEQKVREMRKIGLGIMGLAQLYIQLGVKYGSDEADEIARRIMTQINHESKWTSHELAQQRGPFSDWEDSKYADPTEYREVVRRPDRPRRRRLGRRLRHPQSQHDDHRPHRYDVDGRQHHRRL